MAGGDEGRLLARDAVVGLLLKAGANPNARSAGTGTPLHSAAALADSFAVVKRLLDAGAEVDLARAPGPFRIAIAPAGASYVFNASGQAIDLAGLICLYDADGPCANAVRDAQRTKTSADTHGTLSVIWGCAGFEARLAETERWYRELLALVGATTMR